MGLVIEEWPISKLIGYARNPRRNDDQVSRMVASIKEFGFRIPIVARSDGTVVDGHLRLKAAGSLGMETVPVVLADELTDTQVKAFRILANQSANWAAWDNDLLKLELKDLKGEDFDLDLIGFSDEDMAAIGFDEDAAESEMDADAVPNVDAATAVSVPGDIWLLGDHRLMCGDSTDAGSVALLMAGEKADMVFTDPPYGVSYADKNAYLNTVARGNHIQTPIANDHMGVSDTGDFIYKAFCNIKANLAHRSSYYITAPQGGELLMMMTTMQKAEIPFRHCLIWSKNNHVLGRCDYMYKHEPILFGWCEVHDFYGAGDFKFSVWDIPKPQKSDLHPTMKPVALVVNAIKNSTLPGQIVMDLFGGSGTTLIACEETGRRSRLMELDPHYCDVIVQRWQEMTGLEAKLGGDGRTFAEVQEERA